jgi:hypothetical protein
MDQEQQPSRSRHYSAALRQAGTLVIVIASFNGLWLRPSHELHWPEYSVWVLTGVALLILGARLGGPEVPT